MHGGRCEAALQRRIGLRMPERHARRRRRVSLRLDALDAAAQTRKRVRARAGHAPLPRGAGPSQVSVEPAANPFVHDMF